MDPHLDAAFRLARDTKMLYFIAELIGIINIIRRDLANSLSVSLVELQRYAE